MHRCPENLDKEQVNLWIWTRNETQDEHQQTQIEMKDDDKQNMEDKIKESGPAVAWEDNGDRWKEMNWPKTLVPLERGERKWWFLFYFASDMITVFASGNSKYNLMYIFR